MSRKKFRDETVLQGDTTVPRTLLMLAIAQIRGPDHRIEIR